MRSTLATLRGIPLLLLAFALCGCLPDDGDEGSSGGGGGSPGASWITDPAPVTGSNLPLADVSSPTHVIGTGSAGSVTLAALQTAMTAGGTIVFNSGGAPVTLHLTAQLNVPDLKTVVIDGGGLVTLDADLACRIIRRGWKTHLTVQRLAFVEGDATGYAGDGTAKSGGAINNDMWDGSLTVIDCTFTNCRAIQTGPDTGGGAIRAIGQRHTRISNCTFTGCSGASGGALSSLGSQLTVLGCTFTGNHATAYNGGAIYIDGIHLNAEQPRLTIERSTFTGNTGKEFGGALFCVAYRGHGSTASINACTFAGNALNAASPTIGFAGAVYLQDAATTIVNTTFSANTSTNGVGALWLLSDQVQRITNCTFSGNTSTLGCAGLDVSGTALISNCTIAGNRSGNWPVGMRVGTSNQVWLKNCLFHDNVVTAVSLEDQYNGWHISWPANDAGGNLQWPANRGSTGMADTKVTAGSTVADPQLSALGSNGGPTQTHAVPASSPAVDAGSDTDRPARDQRGLPRANRSDIGAYEFQPPPIIKPGPG